MSEDDRKVIMKDMMDSAHIRGELSRLQENEALTIPVIAPSGNVYNRIVTREEFMELYETLGSDETNV